MNELYCALPPRSNQDILVSLTESYHAIHLYMQSLSSLRAKLNGCWHWLHCEKNDSGLLKETPQKWCHSDEVRLNLCASFTKMYIPRSFFFFFYFLSLFSQHINQLSRL